MSAGAAVAGSPRHQAVWDAPFLQRPILGGAFGSDRYFLATTPLISRGLHTVRFMVIDLRTGAVLSVAEEKTQALAPARRLLLATVPEQAALWPAQALPLPARERASTRRRPVARRRREVFEKSAGRCHYCAAPLRLDGRWHVERQMPRALGGADEISNLVAACAPCNLGKGDRTAVEFVVGQAAKLDSHAIGSEQQRYTLPR